ncbi:MAG: Bor family protein [Bdellovibrionales bacterium]|nr:Bor family protein [Bdellovibrionales bacterium]
MKKVSILISVLFLLSSCQTVTISKGKRLGDGNWHQQRTISLKPDYEKSHSFFLGGLVGEGLVYTNRICPSKEIRQIQTQFTFLDRFLHVITLGIYSPRTSKVWCKNPRNKVIPQ